MRYSKNLLYIDLVLVVSIIPVFFILPLLMKLFLIIGVIFIVLDKPYIKIVALIGGLFLFLSFYKAIYSVGVFRTYIMFLISFLSYGVVLQRLKKEVNFWLVISPFLFLILSLVMYQNIYMLFYAIFEVFVFIFSVIYLNIKDFKVSIKEAIKIFLFSLPFVVILFLFFPRFYMLKANFGFKSKYARSGFSGEIVVDSKNVINSNRVVFEAKFDKTPKSLYFRGDVLYKNIGNRWIESLRVTRDVLRCLDKVSYRLKQYPTNERYVFALDVPTYKKDFVLTPFYTLKSRKNLKRVLNTKLISCDKYRLLNREIPLVAYEYNKNLNKKTQKLIENIKKIKSDKKRLEAIEKLFINQKIVYTLNPPKMDTLNIVDSLFETKRGYCIHFASAFATLARMVGLPSRVVSGFLAKRVNMYKNFVVVRERDAHAWVEVYLKDKGWVRIDPTNFAYNDYNFKKKNVFINKTNNNNTKKVVEDKIDKSMLILMYIRFTIEEWILNYDIFKQKRLLKLLENREFLLKAMVIFLGFILVITLFIYYINRKKIAIEDKIIYKLLSFLEKKGYKKENETIYSFLSKIEDKRIEDINTLYHKIKFFKKNRDDIKNLKKLVNRYIKSK